MSKKIILWFPLILPLYVLRMKIGPLPTTVLEIAFGIVVLCATFAPLRTKEGGWGEVWREGWRKTSAWHLPAALWIFATLVAIFIAPDHVAALGLWRAYVLEPMLFALLLAGAMRDEKDRETVVASLVGAVTFVSLIALFQFVTNVGIPHPWDTEILTRRATSLFPFPNAVSLFCAPIAALCAGMLVNRSAFVTPVPGSVMPAKAGIQPEDKLRSGAQLDSRLRGNDTGILWLGFLSGLLATILAKSVGGFLAILAASLVTLIWNKKTRRATIIAGAAVIVLAFAIAPVRAKIVKTLSFNEWSGQVRFMTWNETLNMLKDHPVFGAGLGAYPDAMKPYHTHTAIEIFQYPHDILLNLWSETGLLGVIAFGWICVTWFRRSIGRDGSRPYVMALIAILVHGLVDVPYFKNDLAMLFWIFAAMV